MKVFLHAAIFCVLTTVPGEGQTGNGGGGSDSIWNQVRRYRERNWLRKMPALIQVLEMQGRNDVIQASRCHFEVAMMRERLGDRDGALEALKQAMRFPRDQFGQKATLIFARWTEWSGEYAFAIRALKALLRELPDADSTNKLSIVDVEIELARIYLEAGNPGRALAFCEKARVKMNDDDPGTNPFWLNSRYELACIEGRSLESLGAFQAAIRRYWVHLEQDPDGCAKDPRIPMALAERFRKSGELPQFRAALEILARRSGPLTAASSLLEYLDLKDLVDRGNYPGLMTELEGIDPPIWNDGNGPDWHFFLVSRILAERNPLQARDVVLSHIERNGYFTLGVYILGLVGDEKSLKSLYHLAVAETSHRDLMNITTAIARNRCDMAVDLLKRLQKDTSAAHPTELRRAAQVALQSLPPVGQSIH